MQIRWQDNFTQQFEETARYRLDGNKISKTTNYSDGLTEQRYYTYDDIGRLTSELYEVNDIRKWSKSYAFDTHSYCVENKITYTDYNNNNNSSITTNSYDPNNKLTDSETKDLNNNTTHYINLYYDDAGNVAEKIDHLTGESVYYSYDALNRMSSCTIPTIIGDMTTTFQYDAVGQRFKKQNGNQVTISLWEKGKIIEDIRTTGSMISKNMYVQGLFTEGVVKPETNEYGYQEYGDFYINSFDTNNDVITTWLINTDTNPSNYSYDAYGNGVNFLPSPYGYNGYYRDSETGLYYLNARYYDPTTQQFTQEDTYWGDGTDLYAYCHFNPVMYSDPSGHISMSEIAELWAKDYAMEAANAQYVIDNYMKYGKYGKIRESTCESAVKFVNDYIYHYERIATPKYDYLYFSNPNDLTWDDFVNAVKTVPGGLTKVKSTLQFPSTVGKITAASAVGVISGKATFGDVFTDLKNFKFFNQNENIVLESKIFSSYKGTPVIRQGLPNGSSFSFANTIMLNSIVVNNPEGILTVKHEWGHNVQDTLIGTPKFIFHIAVPSMIGCAINPSDQIYFSLPWERSADYFGGVDSGYYLPGSDIGAFLYLLIP